MPTETNSQKPAVQAPAQTDKPVEQPKTPLPVVKPEPAAEPKAAGVVQKPSVDYDKYRGQGGDYIVDERGHRVPAPKK